MNKGFFVVFLGIVVGAMALIFFNQASTPASSPTEPTTVAEAPTQPTQPAQPGQPGQPDAKPEPAKPEPAKPEPAKPEPAKPEPAKPEPAKPEPAKPEPAKSEPEKPEPAKAETPVTSEPAKPEPAKPEPAKPEPVKPEPAAAEPAKPEPAKTVTPAAIKKNPSLKNIGLHFKDKGLVLRIEADGGFSYKTFVLPTPDRYVVDLGGTWSNMRVPAIPANNMIKSARVGNQAGGPRIVLDLQRAPKKHRVTWVAPTVLEIYME
ncbi:MAG: hypothetical protein DELT_01360 [Desulfovibrio sp.]